MTDEELTAIHAQWVTYAGPLEPVIRQMRDILGEVSRVRAENAAMREIVQAVADMEPGQFANTDGYCSLCGEYVGTFAGQDCAHDPACPVTQARELLHLPPNS